MAEAILYRSNSGYTKQYAELLAGRLGIPAYNAANALPPALRGKPVIFMSWLMAGGLQGYKKIAAAYKLTAICAVGMAPKSQDQIGPLREKCRLDPDMPLFYLQGGFDMNRLSGVYKLMMRAMRKVILSGLAKKTELTSDEQAMYKMCTEGLNCVSSENLDEIVSWYEGARA